MGPHMADTAWREYRVPCPKVVPILAKHSRVLSRPASDGRAGHLEDTPGTESGAVERGAYGSTPARVPWLGHPSKTNGAAGRSR
jgi:hypothetical protein